MTYINYPMYSKRARKRVKRPRRTKKMRKYSGGNNIGLAHTEVESATICIPGLNTAIEHLKEAQRRHPEIAKIPELIKTLQEIVTSLDDVSATLLDLLSETNN